MIGPSNHDLTLISLDHDIVPRWITVSIGMPGYNFQKILYSFV